MTGTIWLFDPRPAQPESAVPVAQALSNLAGKVVGFIDNAKPNFNYLADDLGELLMTKYGVREVLKRQKRAPSVPAPEEVYREFAQRCDLVITGSGD
jgi:hypothetical protein